MRAEKSQCGWTQSLSYVTLVLMGSIMMTLLKSVRSEKGVVRITAHTDKSDISVLWARLMIYLAEVEWVNAKLELSLLVERSSIIYPSEFLLNYT